MDESIYKNNKELIVPIKNKKIFEQILSSTPISRLVHHHCNIDNLIVNFKISEDRDYKYFSFDIADPLTLNIRPWYMYNVKGSYLEYKNGINLVYTLTFCDTDSKIGTFIDKTIKISDNTLLNEIDMITPKNEVIPQLIKIITINNNNSKDEIIVDPESDIYKLYNKGKIDIGTFCNLAFLNLNNNEATNNKEEHKLMYLKKLPKLLKKFIS